MSRKGLCFYDYIDTCIRFNDISLPEKEDFCSSLNMEEITGPDYMQAKKKKKKSKNFEIKNLGEYYDWYFKSNVLILADVFEKMYL